MFAPFFSALILCAVCQLICCLVPLCLRQHALARSVRVRFVSLCESHSDVMICSSCVELEIIYCTETSGFSLFSLMELLVWLSCGLVGLFQPSNRKAKHLQLDFSSGDVLLFPLCENCPSLNPATSTLLP